jgi:DNA-binding CsgD family transcriptional regulator
MESRVESRTYEVLEALQRLYAAEDTEQFPEVMMSVADELVPCVNLSFDIINTKTGVARNGFLRPIPMSHSDFMERWTQLHTEHPGIQFLRNGGVAPTIEISDFVTEREFRETGLYQDIFQPLSVAHQLGIILPVEGYVVGIAMNRDRPFTAQERRLMEHLHPHFALAFQRTQIFAALQAAQEIDHAPWRRSGLTRRECEVLQWLMEGKRNREIGVILGLQLRTVDTHVVNLFAKLGVQTRTAAARRAQELLKRPPNGKG